MKFGLNSFKTVTIISEINVDEYKTRLEYDNEYVIQWDNVSELNPFQRVNGIRQAYVYVQNLV